MKSLAYFCAMTLVTAQAAFAQGNPTYSADQLTNILGANAGVEGEQPAYSADDLANILSPQVVLRTRSLKAGQGPEPGAPGSGVVPDLRIHFGFNSWEISPQARAQLDELGKALQRDELRSLKFQIAGHTDAVGSDTYNTQLSQKRADAVVGYLEQNFGIDGARLRSVGMGEADLVDWNDPASGKNRRVEVRTQ